MLACHDPCVQRVMSKNGKYNRKNLKLTMGPRPIGARSGPEPVNGRGGTQSVDGWMMERTHSARSLRLLSEFFESQFNGQGRVLDYR